MVEVLICGYNIFCHINNLNFEFQRPKYPPDVAKLCYYFEEQKLELPEYCKWKDEVNPPPRRRNEF
jgi:hypothetical protein